MMKTLMNARTIVAVSSSLLVDKSYQSMSSDALVEAAAGAAHPLEVALVAVPMLGHMMPLLPYAEELLRRGHKVTFFHAQDRKYRRKLEDSNLHECTSVTYEDWNDIHDCVRDYYTSKQEDDDGGESPLSSSKNKPSVLAYDFFAAEAADAADAMGVPAVGVFPNPKSVNPWAATVEDQESYKWVVWQVVCKGLEAVLSRLLWCNRALKRWRRGLPMLPEQDIYPSVYMTRPMIGCASPEFEFDTPNSPLYHMVGPSLPTTTDPIGPELNNWLQSQKTNGSNNKPIVYVAFGSMFRYTPEIVQNLEAQLLDLDVAVLWSLPAEEQSALTVGNTLPHWHVESFLPQVSLFRGGHVQAFVTHCGSNSVAEALLTGIPMVCCPGMADQPANASRIARAGVGVIARIAQKGGGGRTSNVGLALRQLLSKLDTFTQTSKALAQKMQQNTDGAELAANFLEKIAREGVPEVPRKRRLPWWPLPIVGVLCGIFLPLL